MNNNLDAHSVAEQSLKLQDPEVRQALQILFDKEITFDQIRHAYEYFGIIQSKNQKNM